MKAITLTQPWAQLVALRQKTVETRSWSTQYRGDLVIHAAKGFPKWAKDTCEEYPFRDCLNGLTAKTLPLGVGLCVVRLVGCFPTGEGGLRKLGYAMGCLPNMREIEFGDYTEGRFAWLLEYVYPFVEPIPAKGALGLWEWKGPTV